MEKNNIAVLAEKLNRAGVPDDYGHDMSRLLNHIWREVARGRPVTRERIDQIVAELAISVSKAEAFLRKMAERDADDNIIGILGLSQDNKWAHRLNVNGVDLRTWCAWDQFFLAQVLGITVQGESECPVSHKKIDISINPGKVLQCHPSSMVISMVMLDPDKHDRRKIEELWSSL